MKRTNLVIEFISALLILLFVYTGSSKLLNYEDSYGSMNNQPFPNWMTSFLLWGVIISELVISGLLMFNKTKKIGLWSSLVLMSLFTLYIAAILLHLFDRVPCSCGGVIKKLGWTNHLYFNLFFVAISIIGLLLMSKQKKQTEADNRHQVIFT